MGLKGIFDSNRKGQITIFIILGMVILASAIFLYYIISQTTLTNLQSEQESGIAGIFQKEGLRLYVEDCIKDSLEEGLVLIGEGGRLFEENSGIDGALSYSENINGIEYLGTYYYLGIVNNLDQEFPNNYPCDENLDESPAYCMYIYPNYGDFGHKEGLSIQNIQSDLEKYMREDTVSCIGEFLESELSYSEDLDAGDLVLSLEIKNDGIDLSVEYPLELIVEGETYFHLTEFDYFYESQLKTFLQKAVVTPLGKEQRDPTFKWSEEELSSSSSYISLSPELVIEEVEANSLGGGNRIVSYSIEPGKILDDSYLDDYHFSFAIANRPPALDFIQREACSEFDYFVISGVESELGNIEILAVANDPDDDNIVFNYDANELSSGLEFETEELGILDSSFGEDNFVLGENTYGYNITANVPASFSPAGIYNLTINASDVNKESDFQDVRILIDRPLELEVSVENPYLERGAGYYYGYNIYPVLSIEDPFFVKITVPSESVSSDVSQYTTISYTDTDNVGDFSYNLPSSLTENYCFSFPWTDSHTNCLLSDYSENEFENWKELIESNPSYSHMSYAGGEDSNFVRGSFELEFNAKYCSTFTQQETKSQDVYVTECIPLQNASHPYAYPYHKEMYDLVSGEYLGEEEINPFYANHSCCNYDYSLKDEDETCYESPIGCYSAIEGWTTATSNLVLEQQFDYCSGKRGNVCGSLNFDGSTKESKLIVDEDSGKEVLICGDSSYSSCSSTIADKCAGEESWSYLDEDNGQVVWCNGEMGCTSDICVDPAVYVGPRSDISSFMDENGYDSISEFAIDVKATTNRFGGDFEFVCGCSQIPDEFTGDAYCDYNRNYQFEGVCQSGACVER